MLPTKDMSTCSATRPPSCSLMLTKVFTSPFSKPSKLSMEGGSGSGTCFGVVSFPLGRSGALEVVAATALVGTPFVEAEESLGTDAISSKREVAASSLQTNLVSVLRGIAIMSSLLNGTNVPFDQRCEIVLQRYE